LSPDVVAFVASVNDGRFTFPHAYTPKQGRQLIVLLPFDAIQHELHAEVRAAATAIADQNGNKPRATCSRRSNHSDSKGSHR
jgi:hypothetical protein